MTTSTRPCRLNSLIWPSDDSAETTALAIGGCCATQFKLDAVELRDPKGELLFRVGEIIEARVAAKGEKADLRHGMNLGADDYLTKPADIDDLVAAIEARLARRSEHAAGAGRRCQGHRQRRGLAGRYGQADR